MGLGSQVHTGDGRESLAFINHVFQHRTQLWELFAPSGSFGGCEMALSNLGPKHPFIWIIVCELSCVMEFSG